MLMTLPNGARGRVILQKDMLLRVYRLATRESQELIEAHDLEERARTEWSQAVVYGACIFQKDFTRVKEQYASLSSYEAEMEQAIGDRDFLIVLARPDKTVFIHEFCHALFHLDHAFREYALAEIRSAPDYPALASAIVERYEYDPAVLEEEAISYAVAELYGSTFMLLNGNQFTAERIRMRVRNRGVAI